MEPTLKFQNQAAWEQDLQNIASVSGKAGDVVLHQQAGLLVRDAAKFTPPTGKQPINESWNDQKKAGVAAVEGDIKRGFAPADDLKAFEHIKNQKTRQDVQNYMAQGRYSAARILLTRMGISTNLVAAANSQLHSRMRDARGRVRRGKTLLVMKKASIAALIKEKQAEVGKAKSGWVPAAQSLGVKLPGWVTRHHGSGIYRENKRQDFSSITVGNTVGFIQSAGARLNVMERALKRRSESMRNQMNAQLGRAFAGYKGKSK